MQSLPSKQLKPESGLNGVVNDVKQVSRLGRQSISGFKTGQVAQ
jgi:hypothetical protein